MSSSSFNSSQMSEDCDEVQVFLDICAEASSFSTDKIFDSFCEKIGSKKFKRSYKLGKLLGEGTFGEVRQATLLSTGDQVAVKIINKKVLYLPTTMAALKNEICILRKLQHDNVIKMHEALHDRKKVYIVTELCTDGNLYDWQENEQDRSELATLRVMKQALSALAYLHGKGVVHRDIKLENIAISSGSVRLIDFGLSRENEHGGVLGTDFAGSDRYLSPEMWEELPFCPHAADVWAIGVALYELLTNDMGPIVWKEEHFHAMVMKKWLLVRLSRGSRRLLEQMLENDPSKRITAEEALFLITDIIEYMEGSEQQH